MRVKKERTWGKGFILLSSYGSLLTFMTDILSNKGLKSGVLIGLELLLWPGVEALLPAAKREPKRWGSCSRTMMGGEGR